MSIIIRSEYIKITHPVVVSFRIYDSLLYWMHFQIDFIYYSNTIRYILTFKKYTYYYVVIIRLVFRYRKLKYFKIYLIFTCTWFLVISYWTHAYSTRIFNNFINYLAKYSGYVFFCKFIIRLRFQRLQNFFFL